MFIFCTTLLIILILAIIINVITDDYNDFKIVTCVISWVAGIMLFFCVLCIPINRFWNLDDVAAFKAFQQTLNEQRAGASEYERAILTSKIIDWNTELAKWKNQNVWYRCDWWIHDDIKKLEPIK